MTAPQLDAILREAGIDPNAREKVIDFLLYYGVVGTRMGEIDHFIYSVNYDLKVLKIRASRLPKQRTTSSIRHFGPRWVYSHPAYSRTDTGALRVFHCGEH
jgi:hypothetical protein